MARPITTSTATDNKNIVQSYLLTEARYKFSVTEKRILYRLIEAAQCEISGILIKDNLCRVNKDLWDVKIKMPYSSILSVVGENNTHHEEVRTAARSLASKTIEINDTEKGEWWCSSIIHGVHCSKSKEYIEFEVDNFLWVALLDFSKGFTQYQLNTAMKFHSPYTMRFYEMMSGQHRPLDLTLDEIRTRFGVQNKYKLPADLRKRIIEPAKAELDKSSPDTFAFIERKEGRRIVGYTFFPRYNPNVQDPELEREQLIAKTSSSFLLSSETYDYLKLCLEFEPEEINKNKKTFLEGEKTIPDFIDFLVSLHSGIRKAKNPKGYVINAVKRKTKEILSTKEE